MAFACTGVGVLKPACASRAFRLSETLKSAKCTSFSMGRPVRGSITVFIALMVEWVLRVFGAVSC
jgi:hypothetical protein